MTLKAAFDFKPKRNMSHKLGIVFMVFPVTPVLNKRNEMANIG